MSVFLLSQYGKVEEVLPYRKNSQYDNGERFSFTEVYQTYLGHNSYQINIHYAKPRKHDDGSEYIDCCGLGSINADSNKIVRWVEGFETIQSREDLGRKHKALYTCIKEIYIPLIEAIKRMETNDSSE